ncbi:MAG: hypothetical protein ACLUB8_01135 [Limosilactobacillus vaginalis]|uniref:hypothetical protein n=1 Tax=Limosilactobacillus vaginalis TaxID=1633 RepID=UPI0039934692
MIAFTAIWLLLGLIAILALLTLAIKKKIKWNFFGLALAIYLLLSFIFLIVAGSPSSMNSAKESNQSSQQSMARIFKLIYSDDDDYNGEIHFDSNKDGKYTVKIKGLQNGKVKLKNADDSQEKFKTQTFTIKKGQTLKIPITLKSDDLVHDFELEDSNGNKKDFSVYNNSDIANSIADSMSESNKEDKSNNNESESSTNDSYQDSLNARKDNWNSSSDGDAIKVKKVSQELHTTIITVDEAEWDSLSIADKISFLEDWNDSVKKIYSMSDKNGTTSIQVVSSSNKYDMLGHCTPSGKAKVDD